MIVVEVLTIKMNSTFLRREESMRIGGEGWLGGIDGR